jgi:GT2 family glycosyltransferase
MCSLEHHISRAEIGLLRGNEKQAEEHYQIGSTSGVGEDMAPVTVIVTGRNRKGKLGLCLDSLEQQTLRPAQIIYVDTGSTDDLLNLVTSRFPGVKIVRNGSGNPQLGRNLGAIAASQEWLLFSDDDVVLDFQALERMFNYARVHPETGLIGGRKASIDPSHGGSTILASYCMASPLWLPREGRYTSWTGALRVYTVRNIYLIKRDVFNRVGGWCENLFIQFDEVVMCHSVYACGLNVVCLADALYIDLNRDRGDELKEIPEVGVSRESLSIRNSIFVTLMGLPAPLILFFTPLSLLLAAANSLSKNRIRHYIDGLKSLLKIITSVPIERRVHPRLGVLAELRLTLGLLVEEAQDRN